MEKSTRVILPWLIAGAVIVLVSGLAWQSVGRNAGSAADLSGAAGKAQNSQDASSEFATVSLPSTGDLSVMSPAEWDGLIREALLPSEGGDHEASLRMLAAILTVQTEPSRRAQPARLEAQILVKLNRLEEAAASYAEALAAYESDPELLSKPWHFTGFASVVNQYSLVLMRQNKLADAIAVEQRLIDAQVQGLDVQDPFTGGAVAAAYEHNATRLGRLGEREKAASQLNRLFERFPDFATDPERTVALRLQRAGFQSSGPAGEAVLLESRALWSSSELATLPQSMQAGEALATALAARQRYSEAVDVRLEMLDRLDRHGRSWISQVTPPLHRQSHEEVSKSVDQILWTLTGAGTYGRPSVALDAISRLRSRTSDPTHLESLAASERGIIDRAAAEAELHAR